MMKPILALFTAATLAGTTMFHAELKSSVPAKGAMLHASPKSITLTFSEGVLLPATGISVLKADSSLVEKLTVKAVAGDTTVAGDLKTTLAPGKYIVKWRNGAKDDGHKESGAFAFMVMAN